MKIAETKRVPQEARICVLGHDPERNRLQEEVLAAALEWAYDGHESTMANKRLAQACSALALYAAPKAKRKKAIA